MAPGAGQMHSDPAGGGRDSARDSDAFGGSWPWSLRPGPRARAPALSLQVGVDLLDDRVTAVGLVGGHRVRHALPVVVKDAPQGVEQGGPPVLPGRVGSGSDGPRAVQGAQTTSECQVVVDTVMSRSLGKMSSAIC